MKDLMLVKRFLFTSFQEKPNLPVKQPSPASAGQRLILTGMWRQRS